MQQRIVDLGLVRDLLHARTVDAVAHENRIGSIEDAGSRVDFDLAGWFNHPAKHTPGLRNVQ
jgi:hypothetical protein